MHTAADPLDQPRWALAVWLSGDALHQCCGDLLAQLKNAAHTECPCQGEAGIRKANGFSY